MASPLPGTFQSGASQADLAQMTGLSVRTLRELIRLRAVEQAWLDGSGKLIYSIEHYQQVKRAKLLLDAGLTVRDAASMCEATIRQGRVPNGLPLPHLRHVKGKSTTWQTDGVRITISADCCSETERLVRALAKAIDATRNSEKELRRRLRSGSL